MPDNYDHRQVEKRWQNFWEEQAVYIWQDNQSRENTFVIDTPPPTVSGSLHMGHIFSYTQADFVARYQRMLGKDVFYPMGFDDNGLPTERLVEKVKKIKATDVGREKFIEICEEVTKDARLQFRDLFTSTALSVDWRQEYHTISAESRKISQLSFMELYNQKQPKTYRKLQPMFWDPVDQTAIAQAEIEDKEMASNFCDIYFKVLETDENIVIATTRPELIGACVAVFYHPDDARYQHLQGKTAVTALFGVKVPILADDAVKMDKGTGLVMCCTFGDETDIMWWNKHGLKTRIMLNNYGKIAVTTEANLIKYSSLNVDSANIGTGDVVDMERAAEFFNLINNKKTSNNDPKNPGAREIIIKLLQENNLLIKLTPIVHSVKCAERSGAALEIMPTYQWFIKVLDAKEELKAKAGQCNWHPEYMSIRMLQWIDGLAWDWCISRQRYFGVPFPVWYSKRAGEEGKILLAHKDDLPVNPIIDLPRGYARDEVTAETDVMDTWATSSVSPQLSSKAITEDYAVDFDRHQKLFPADLRPQAHEIIRSWAFYTIVKAHLHQNVIPWKNLMISGWCLASDKSKMSKSKGNVITPIELITEKGSDVVRFWASTSRLGADTAFSEDVLKIGKKLVTKLFNATKFAAAHLEKIDLTNKGTRPSTAALDIKNNIITEALDLWILSRLQNAVKIATAQFEIFEYCEARVAIEDFFWNDFCDNYLELVKVRVYGQKAENSEADGRGANLDPKQKSAIYTIYHCLLNILKLFAPFVPHVTEELYSHIFKHLFNENGSIHKNGTWPVITDFSTDEMAERGGIAAVAILNIVRKIKAERNVSIKFPLHFININSDASNIKLIADFAEDLKNVTSAAAIYLNNTQVKADVVAKTEDNLFEVGVGID